MRRRIPIVVSVLALFVGACADRPDALLGPGDPSASAAASPDAVPERKETRWSRMTAAELWNHVAGFDTTVVVGLKSPGAQRGIWRGILLIDDTGREAARDAITMLPDVELVGESADLPVLELRVGSPLTIAALRDLPSVDYVEPAVMDIALASLGCGYNAWTGTADSTQWGDILPPHYTRSDVQIDLAWTRSRGEDVVVGILDTGVSYYQNHLHGSFATGQSTGRWHFHTSVLPGDGSHPAWHDQCSHGTRVAGAAVAPMNGQNMVGVAWKSDLLAVRFSDDVIMPRTLQTEQAVSIAASYTPSGETVHPRRVVGMAWGHKDWYSPVADQISYRYHQHGVLFVGASGTSGWWGSWTGVVFPARMNEVIAVSAVNADYSSSSQIHYGSEVELTFILNQVTTGFVTPDVVSLGGSSGATAIVSGIAAVVWGQYPSASRDWVRQRLQWAGHNYPSRNSTVGYGVTNVWKAVGGLYDATLDVQLMQAVPFEYYTYRVTAVPSGDGPFTYEWSTGATTNYVEVTVQAGHSAWVGVTISDGGASLHRQQWLQGPQQATASINGPSAIRPGMMCAWLAETNSPDDPYTYQWTIDRSIVSTDPVLHYSSEVPFTIGLTVTDAAQRQMSTALNVSIDPKVRPRVTPSRPSPRCAGSPVPCESGVSVPRRLIGAPSRSSPARLPRSGGWRGRRSGCPMPPGSKAGAAFALPVHWTGSNG